MEESKKLRARPGVSLSASKTPVSTAADDDPTGGGTAALIVMCAVLTIIVLFCCFAAPGIRDLCKRYIFKSCVVDDPESNNVYTRRYGPEEIKVMTDSDRKEKVSRQGSRSRASGPPQ